MRSLALEERRIWGDRGIVIAVVVLAAAGLLSVFATTGINSEFAGLRSQAQGLVIAAIAAVVLSQVPTRTLLRFSLVLGLVALLFFALTFIGDLGVSKNGARRSLRIGGLQFMPAELAKPALLLLWARILSSWGGWGQGARIGHGALVGAIIVLMVATKDLGTPFVIVITLGLMWFLSGARLGHVLLTIGAGAAAVVALIALAPHRIKYVRAWLDPFCHQATADGLTACRDATAALRASFMAIADGGLLGRPLGAGQGPLHLLEADNDFIGAVVAEQFGLLGFGLFAFIFIIIIAQSLRLADRADDPELALVAAGAGMVIGLQGLIHLAVVCGAIPPKGLTLPLVSLGTSSHVAIGILIGMLVRVGREQAWSEG